MAQNDDLHDVAAEAVPENLAGVAAARDGVLDDLLALDHVVGAGVGSKIVDGRPDADRPAVIVLVDTKLPTAALGSDQLVPEEIDGRPTDVVEVGTLFAGGGTGTDAPAVADVDARSLTGRVRPARPGYSCGHPKVTAGTIGGGCYDLAAVPGKPPRYYILSNNHVLANSNDASIGDPIYQPGVYDGGGPADAIGRLTRFVPIKFDGTCNYVDAAVAEVPFHVIDRDIYWTGVPASAARAATDRMLLKKTGRTTNFTTGRVTALNATVDVNYGSGRVARFCNQIVTTDMSAGGDSGSLVLDLEDNPVGLLFAGSSTATILNPIATVQLALGVRLWP